MQDYYEVDTLSFRICWLNRKTVVLVVGVFNPNYLYFNDFQSETNKFYFTIICIAGL